MNMPIKSIHARQLVDCKCRPMVEVDVITEDGSLGRACAPTGTTVGKFESFVLRDNDPSEYHGLSVHKAVDNVNSVIAPALIGKNVFDQEALDQRMLDLDGTPDKHVLGGNAIYSVSVAALRAAAAADKKELCNYLAGGPITQVPVPSFNVINGGRYATLTQPFNEFIIMPYRAASIYEAVEMSVLTFQKLVVDKKNYMMSSLRPPQETKLKGVKRFAVSAPVYIVVFLAMLPQIVVICQSFVERSFSGMVKGINFNNYRLIASRLGTNIRNTYVFSIVAIVFIVVVGILVSYVLVRKKGKVASIIDTLIMFPYVIPGSVLGIGLIIAFNRKPIVLVGTAAIMIISYIIRKLPYTVRSGSAFLYQMDPFIEEASINLGVSPMKTFFTVTARMMLPGIMSGAVLSWITCINELSSSIMLYSGKTSTIAVAIYQEVTRMSDGTAAALATILTLSTALSLLIVFRLTKGKVKIV